MSIVSETATLAHGYTMADVESIARQATRVRFGERATIDADESLAIAWHGVVETLYTAVSKPSRYELVGAGVRALLHEVSLLRSYYGRGQREYRGQAAPGFVKYWGVRRDNDDGFTDRVVERLALPAVLAVLTPKQYEAISTLAAFDGDMRATAAALGIPPATLESALSRARSRIRAVWFEHETPRRKHRVEGMCLNGHSRAEHSERDSYGRWKCMTCSKSSMRRGRRRYEERKKAEASAAS